MTIPPIFFRDLKMALKWVSKAFLLSAETKFGSKNVIFYLFWAKMTKIGIQKPKLIVTNDYQKFWAHFDCFYHFFKFLM